MAKCLFVQSKLLRLLLLLAFGVEIPFFPSGLSQARNQSNRKRKLMISDHSHACERMCHCEPTALAHTERHITITNTTALKHVGCARTRLRAIRRSRSHICTFKINETIFILSSAVDYSTRARINSFSFIQRTQMLKDIWQQWDNCCRTTISIQVFILSARAYSESIRTALSQPITRHTIFFSVCCVQLASAIKWLKWICASRTHYRLVIL